MNRVMIIAGESSGELYGALLAKALRKKFPGVTITGIGGKRMEEAEVTLVSEISDAFGLTEAVSSYRKIRTAFKNAVRTIKYLRPDVVVLIDYPDFNLKVAEVAKSVGVKILYYVSPQVWAWRKGRVKKISALVDRMAVILPFEEKIYRDAGVKCEFVGHPMVEEIEAVLESTMKNLPPLCSPLVRGGVGGWSLNPEFKPCLKSDLGLDPTKPLLSLLPGSRPHELKRLLPLTLDVVRQFKNEFTDYQFSIPLAPNTDEKQHALHLESLMREEVPIKKGESVRVLAASDIAVVASGTATLQTALLEVPMVVIYKLSPLTYLLGKMIVDVKYISIVNILAGKEVVRELLQKRANPAEILKEIREIIKGKTHREEMILAYKSIKESFLGKKASERVSEMICEMAGW
ncbi:MAG: hypothetical protein AB1390_04780 [Nitrospirota bacterium]